MNVELSDYERIVFRHARRIEGAFSKIQFLGRYIDAERVKEITGVDPCCTNAHRYLMEEKTPQRIRDKQRKWPIQLAAEKFEETFFQKRGQEQTPSPPQNIMSGPR